MSERYRDGLVSMPRRRTFGAFVDAVQSALDVDGRLAAAGFDPSGDVTTPAGVSTLLAQLFRAGVVGSATLSYGSRFNFDTHSDHYAQHPLATALNETRVILDGLAAMPLTDGLSVLDRTTVVMSGEFARTARLNSSMGKDHNLRTNSLVFIGHRVRPGVFGTAGARSVDGVMEPHAAMPVDVVTGVPSASGHVMKARDVWAGFGGIAGLDLSSEFGPDVVPVGFLGGRV